MDLLRLSTYVTRLVHMSCMLYLEGRVENLRIFYGLSPSFLIHYFPSFCILFCFLFVPFFCIYIGVSILCNTHSLI